MADARDEHVWTVHAKQHEDYTKPYAQSDGFLIRKWLLECVPAGATVVDFGCGSGLWRDQFKEYNYLGVDQNAAMIKVAKGRDPAFADRFSQIQWDKLPYEDNSIDVIFTAAVLQHNKHDQKAKVVREFVRVLKPGGIYLATENTFRPDNFEVTFSSNNSLGWHDRLDDGYSFTAGGWKRFMEPLGLRQEKFEAPGEYLYRKV
jgi:ubiquinone/menaquinone biosynthesis C-methylase UbiE